MPSRSSAKRGSSKKSDKTPSGIRVQLKGLRTTREMRAMLHEAIDQLEALGITHLRGSNLYVTPADQEGNPLTRFGPQREKVATLTIAGPYRSAAEEHGL